MNIHISPKGIISFFEKWVSQPYASSVSTPVSSTQGFAKQEMWQSLRGSYSSKVVPVKEPARGSARMGLRTKSHPGSRGLECQPLSLSHKARGRCPQVFDTQVECQSPHLLYPQQTNIQEGLHASWAPFTQQRSCIAHWGCSPASCGKAELQEREIYRMGLNTSQRNGCFLMGLIWPLGGTSSVYSFPLTSHSQPRKHHGSALPEGSDEESQAKDQGNGIREKGKGF